MNTALKPNVLLKYYGSIMPKQQSIPLELLPVFAAVYRQRSVSLAATELGVSQPMASNALRKLRTVFNDALFTRTAAGMLPTPLADELARATHSAMAALDACVLSARQFEPATAQRTFTIAMTDIGEVVFLTALTEYLRQHAPQVNVRTLHLNTAQTREALQTGRADLAIGYIPELSSGTYQQRLFDVRYVCMVRAGHPQIKQGISRKQFMAASHALAVAEGTGHHVVEEHLLKLGLAQRITVRLPSFLALPFIVARSEMICTVPLPLAQAFEQLLAGADQPPLRMLDHPIDLPKLTIRQFWHERYHRDPVNRWLREAVVNLFGPQGQAGH
jgi:DNA-binding transcriptional LysR family regulator